MTVRDSISNGGRRQIENVKGIVYSPKGPFTTVDTAVKSTRTTVREIKEYIIGPNRMRLGRGY